MSCVGGNEREITRVSHHERAPFNSRPTAQLRRSTSGHPHAPQMPATNVVAIGIQEHGLAVARERPLLDFALAGSEELGRSSASRDGIEMLPAVLFAREHDPVISSKMNDAA